MSPRVKIILHSHYISQTTILKRHWLGNFNHPSSMKVDIIHFIMICDVLNQPIYQEHANQMSHTLGFRDMSSEQKKKYSNSKRYKEKIINI